MKTCFEMMLREHCTCCRGNDLKSLTSLINFIVSRRVLNILFNKKKFIHREELEYVSQNDKLGYLIIKVKDCHKRKFEILAHFSLYYGFDIWPLKCIMLNLKLPVDGKISNNEIHF